MYTVEFLPKEKWQGYALIMDYQTDEYYDMSITKNVTGFAMSLIKHRADPPIAHTSDEYDFPDSLYQPHWQKAEAYGISENNELIGAIEICPEEWSNRLAVTELWVKEGHRKMGVGRAMMNKAKAICRERDNRAIILETQSCNANAIGFYLHEGFELIGFDSCCYTNADIERREVRLDLGWFPEEWRGKGRRRKTEDRGRETEALYHGRE